MKKLIISNLLLLLSVNISAYEEWVKKSYLESYNYEKMCVYEDAIKAIMPVYNKYTEEYTPNLRLGWLYYLSAKYENSIYHYKKAIVAAPYSLSAKNYLSMVYLAQLKYENTETISYQVIKSDYYNYHANLYLTLALLGQKKHDLAEKVTLKMLTINPTSVTFLEKLAVIYQSTEETKKLNQIIEDILILDPQNIFANSTKGSDK